MRKRYFIKEAVLTHGDKYDYSKVEYVNSHTKVCIICPEHGEFWQFPHVHINMGCGCPACGDISTGLGVRNSSKIKRPDLSHIEVPEGSKAVPVGTKGDYALVDDEDYDRVMEYNWYVSKGYARNDTVGPMHRFIMNPPDGMVIDHTLHNKLDNRKSQLRVCTKAQNAFNSRLRENKSSVFKGVCWVGSVGRWRSYINFNGERRYLGYFDKEVDAAKAYDSAAREHHGEHALLNFPRRGS